MKKFILLPILMLVCSCFPEDDLMGFFSEKPRSEELKGKWILVRKRNFEHPEYIIFDNIFKRKFLYNNQQNKYFEQKYYWYNDENNIYYQGEGSYFTKDGLSYINYTLNATKDTLTIGGLDGIYYKEN